MTRAEILQRVSTDARSAPQVRLLLRDDEELAAVVPPAELDAARRALAGVAVNVPRGPTTVIDRVAADDGVWGIYVVAGILVRSVSVGRAALPELVGPGEVLGPPVPLDSVLPSEERFTAIERAEIVALGPRAARAMGRWPAMLAVLERRRSAQRLRATTLGAITQLPNVEMRVLAALWHLAETWGRVSLDGTIIPFRFTHEVLGQFVAARRPTVSLSLRKLHAVNLVRRLDDGSWLLPNGSDARLREMLASEATETSIVASARVARPTTRRVVAGASETTAYAEELLADAGAVRAEATQALRRARADRARTRSPLRPG